MSQYASNDSYSVLINLTYVNLKTLIHADYRSQKLLIKVYYVSYRLR